MTDFLLAVLPSFNVDTCCTCCAWTVVSVCNGAPPPWWWYGREEYSKYGIKIRRAYSQSYVCVKPVLYWFS